MENNLVKKSFKYVQTKKTTKSLVKAIDNYIHNKKILEEKQRNVKQSKTVEKVENIEEMVTHEFIDKIRRMFNEADLDGGGELDMNEFITAMRKNYPHYSEKELKIFYMKVDTNCDNSVDIFEYLKYILFEHQEKEHMLEMNRPKPYPKPFKSIPFTNLKSDKFISFSFFPGLHRNGIALDEIDYMFGRYVAVTQHGTMLQLNINLKIIKKSDLFANGVSGNGSKSVWVTAMICIPDMSYVCIADTKHNISFYHVNSSNLNQNIIISGLSSVITCMDYRFSIKDQNNSLLLCGDINGNVIIFYPKSKSINMFNFGNKSYNPMNTETIHVYEFENIVGNQYENIAVKILANCHTYSVIQIKWIPGLNSFLSCSCSTEKSLYMCDFDGVSTKYYSTRKGFTCVDYFEGLNMLITGGQDRLVRIWEPLITIKPANVLTGHNASIVQLKVDEKDSTLISIDKNKNAFIWHLPTSKLLQRIQIIPEILGRTETPIMYLNVKMQKLIICGTKIISFEHLNEILLKHERTTHGYPILSIVYNKVFDVLISADAGSLINVWDVQTGSKVIQILNAHTTNKSSEYETNVEVTALAFDESYRKLISGAHDGTVAIWNFNNGMLIRRFKADEQNTDENCEITNILHKHDRLCLSGWNKTVIVYYLASDGFQFLNKFRIFHETSIVSMDIHNKKLATASYDGSVIIWNIEIGTPQIQIKPKDSITLQYLNRKFFTHKKDEITRRRNETSMENDLDFLKVLEQNSFHLRKIFYLKTRVIDPNTANLLTASVYGWVQAWSTHLNGKVLGQFCALHKPNSTLSTFCVSQNEALLFTGDSLGYIKIWFIGDYCLNHLEAKNLSEINKVKLYFVTKFERIETNSIKEMRNELEAKRRNGLLMPKTNNPILDNAYKQLVSYPQLLQSFRAHVGSISGICYIDEHELILTSSTDLNIRIFTLTGRYIGLFGQQDFCNITSAFNSNNFTFPTKIPNDLRRVASANTFKVVYGTVGPKWKFIQKAFIGVFNMCKLPLSNR